MSSALVKHLWAHIYFSHFRILHKSHKSGMNLNSILILYYPHVIVFLMFYSYMMTKSIIVIMELNVILRGNKSTQSLTENKLSLSAQMTPKFKVKAIHFSNNLVYSAYILNKYFWWTKRIQTFYKTNLSPNMTGHKKFKSEFHNSASTGFS